ncbi:hypothetical protein LEP1GSC050_0067 [Leptospira phage vB_LbrZ_5399-LE1]|uniref:Uncharacterized protein n=1 Tax=Leptospira inadai serovar Lyme TaxID=293084 RepID=A0ABX4YGF5_9LEPT|nr:hypothetical protein [Leptospira inadai]AGS80754.1 hypothetical protein LEP1GSC050_0067 [Leptospira phage vB_LbrZ_5399-LE1]AGS80834.1 hypothetical protein LEP1GSC047_0902 [Leptospira phage vB_LinZ_10-LE1]PNV74330.1 hypothetical protein BES34_014180 [Leptospira inadai serovar Lyme]
MPEKEPERNFQDKAIDAFAQVQIRQIEARKEVDLAQVDMAKSSAIEETRRMEIIIKQEDASEKRSYSLIWGLFIFLVLLTCACFYLVATNHPAGLYSFIAVLSYFFGGISGIGFKNLWDKSNSREESD